MDYAARWTGRHGAKNIKKAQMLYDYIDISGFYSNPVEKSHRSRMNIPFRLRDESLNDLFLKEAKEHGLVELKGHRSVGGCALPFITPCLKKALLP